HRVRRARGRRDRPRRSWAPPSCPYASAAAVDVDEVDARAALADDRVDDRTDGSRRTTGATDDLTEVARVDADLVDGAAAEVLRTHVDVIGVGDDAADEVLDEFGDHGLSSRRTSRPTCPPRRLRPRRGPRPWCRQPWCRQPWRRQPSRR